jgi:hypothetical protein
MYLCSSKLRVQVYFNFLNLNPVYLLVPCRSCFSCEKSTSVVDFCSSLKELLQGGSCRSLLPNGVAVTDVISCEKSTSVVDFCSSLKELLQGGSCRSLLPNGVAVTDVISCEQSTLLMNGNWLLKQHWLLIFSSLKELLQGGSCRSLLPNGVAVTDVISCEQSTLLMIGHWLLNQHWLLIFSSLKELLQGGDRCCSCFFYLLATIHFLFVPKPRRLPGTPTKNWGAKKPWKT